MQIFTLALQSGARVTIDSGPKMLSLYSTFLKVFDGCGLIQLE